MNVVIKLLAIAAIAVVLIHPTSRATVYAQGKLPPEYVEHVQEQLKQLGKTTLTPQKLTEFKKHVDPWRSGHPKDIPIAVDTNVGEFNPSVAANPVDPRYLVAGSQYYSFHNREPNDCTVYISTNGGASWSTPVLVPLLTEDSRCKNPVVAYAPDGSRVYYAYVNDRYTYQSASSTTVNVTIDLDILVRTSYDNGMTWSEPVIALDGTPTSYILYFQSGQYAEFVSGISYYRPWISTPLDAAESDWVYLTATRRDPTRDSPESCYISFTSSNDGSATWSEPVILDQNPEGTSCGTHGFTEHLYVDGSRPAGGQGGNVLVAWYHVGSDGPGVEFEIRTRTSTDHGATWNEIVTAVTDLHQLHIYHRWIEPHFPDVEIDANGGAHIAYSGDPTYPEIGEPWDADFGDIRYIQSSGVPYDTWSAPVTVNDDGVGHTQSWAALETQLVKNTVYVYLMWLDFRLSPDETEQMYDVFSAWKRADDAGWSTNWRVTDESSFLFEQGYLGEYIDMSANKLFVYGVWTDHRFLNTIDIMEHDVFGSWILPIR